MKFLFFFFVLAYLIENFAILFYERPTKFGRVVVLMFFGAWVDAYETIKATLRGL